MLIQRTKNCARNPTLLSPGTPLGVAERFALDLLAACAAGHVQWACCTRTLELLTLLREAGHVIGLGDRLDRPAARGRGNRPGEAARPLLAMPGDPGPQAPPGRARPRCRRGGRRAGSLLGLLPQPQGRPGAAPGQPARPDGPADAPGRLPGGQPDQA